jgi:fibronectin type 3 domain-containing protein
MCKTNFTSKILIFFTMTLLFMAGNSTSFAATVTLSWDANNEPDLRGYKVYYKADSPLLPFNGVGAAEGLSPVDAHNQTTATINGLDLSRTYYFAVTAYDTSGLESAYSNIVTVLHSAPPAVKTTIAQTVIKDTTAPVVSLTSPLNNSSVRGTIAITASARDAVGVSMVEFYRSNGTLLFASNVAPYTFNWDTTSVGNGVYTLVAKARDSAGNSAQSANVSVVVINTLPDRTAPIISAFKIPAAASSLTVGITSINASDSVGITGYLITESAVAPLTSKSGWSSAAPKTFTFSSAGTKTAYAWAKDAAGNVSRGRSASTTITLPATQNSTLSDALLALQVISGKIKPTAQQMILLDVAPVVNGVSFPDGVIDTGDATVLLARTVGKRVL